MVLVCKLAMITMESLRPVEVIRNGTEYLCSSPAWCVCVYVHVCMCVHVFCASALALLLLEHG